MIRTVPFWRATSVAAVTLMVLALLLSPSPALAAKEEALHPRGLGLDPFDHGLLPRNVKCLNDRLRHGQSPEKRCSRQGSP